MRVCVFSMCVALRCMYCVYLTLCEPMCDVCFVSFLARLSFAR